MRLFSKSINKLLWSMKKLCSKSSISGIKLINWNKRFKLTEILWKEANKQKLQVQLPCKSKQSMKECKKNSLPYNLNNWSSKYLTCKEKGNLNFNEDLIKWMKCKEKQKKRRMNCGKKANNWMLFILNWNKFNNK